MKLMFVFLSVLLLLCGGSGRAQTWRDSVVTRGPVWLFPPRKHHTRIVGLGLGMHEQSLRNPEKRLEVDGIHVTVQPLLALFIPAAPLEVVAQTDYMFKPLTARIPYYGHTTRPLDSMVFSDPAVPVQATVNGLAIGTGMGEGTRVNGIALEEFQQGCQVNGVSLGLFQAGTSVLRGVSVSVFNKGNQATGLQLGLLNTCREGRVVQIGLLNRIGNRVRPFINFQFRTHKKAGPSGTGLEKLQ